MKKEKKEKRKHIGISMDLAIYHPRKNITAKEMDKFADEIIELIEKRGWYSGGGWHLVDINKGEMYIQITPKHIKSFDLNL